MRIRTLTLWFLLIRFILTIALPLDGLRAYGDYWNFYALAALPGLPFIHYWVEFPPVFPFISTILFHLAGGREFAYTYLLMLLLALAQAASLGLFAHLTLRLHSGAAAWRRIVAYAALTLALPYGWWYFDALAVLFLLLGLTALLNQRDTLTGIALALGTLTKLFPALLLAAVWRFRTPRRAAWITALALGISALILGTLYAISPQFTAASLKAQAAKGSWNTPWALLDSNFGTGNFGEAANHQLPESAAIRNRNPARVPAWLTLIPFGLLGLWLFRRSPAQGEINLIAFTGLTWCVFLLWSPGFSVQWVLYLLPLMLLVLPERLAVQFAVLLVLLGLVQWPLLLSRGWFWSLWLLIPLRTLLLLLLAFAFAQPRSAVTIT
ncbi:MAG: hypothetical protein OHK0052_12900 [Anaerolineales bacterium]